MDTFRQDALYFPLDKFTLVNAVARADFDQRFMPLRIEFGANILALKGHGLSRIGEVKKNDHATSSVGYRSGRSSWRGTPVAFSILMTHSAGTRFPRFFQFEIWDCRIPSNEANAT